MRQIGIWRLSLQSTKIPMDFLQGTHHYPTLGHRTSDIHPKEPNHKCESTSCPTCNQQNCRPLILSGPLSLPHQRATAPVPQDQAPWPPFLNAQASTFIKKKPRTSDIIQNQNQKRQDWLPRVSKPKKTERLTLNEKHSSHPSPTRAQVLGI